MSRNCTSYVPESQEMLSGLGSVGITLIVISSVATLVTLAMYTVAIVKMVRIYKPGREKLCTIWIVSVFPVVCVTALVGILVPRVFIVNELVAFGYISSCLVVFLQLMLHYYGGSDAMLHTLSDCKIQLRGPPCCCCLVCLPSIKPSLRNIRLIRILVIQSVVINILLSYLMTTVKIDSGEYSESIAENPARTVISLLMTIASFTALYGLLLIYNTSKKPLEEHRVPAKFRVIQLLVILANLQNFLFKLLANLNAIMCYDMFYHPARAEIIRNIMFTIEMMLMMFLVHRYFIHPSEKSTTSEARISKDTDTDPPPASPTNML